ISVRSGVEVKVDSQDVAVKGPKGELSVTIAEPITVSLEAGVITVSRPDEAPGSRALAALARTLLNTTTAGVTDGRSKALGAVGPGYRGLAKGSNLEFALGYSHPITVEPPEGISFSVDGQTKVAVHGIDKQLVGETAANIRKLRRPEPYKGKGVRYAGEIVRRKVGKAGK